MYRVNVKCGNCGNQDRVEIPTGQKVDSTQCPICKVKALFLNLNPFPEVVEVIKDG